MKYLFGIAVFFFHAFGLAQGKVDGFYQKQQTASMVLGLGFEDSKKYITDDTTLDLERSTYYTALFVAYGVTDDFDVNLTIPYIISNNENDFQDVSVLLKYRFLNTDLGLGSFQMGGAAGFSTPLSNYRIGGLNDIGQQATVIESRLLFHYLHDMGWFATTQSGFSFKLEQVPNSIPFTIKLGRATANWYYDLYYDYQHALGGIDYRGTPAPQNFREFGVDFHKIGVTLYKPFSNTFGGYVSVAYTLGGRNTFLGASYGIGLSYQPHFK